MSDTRIASPNDVVAMHYNSGTFSKSVILFTTNKCFMMVVLSLLEDIREVREKG
ncbi:MAG: hypothetical protein R3B93_01705 [Bacteroidia bacterium]